MAQNSIVSEWIQRQEAQDQVRMTWNQWPLTSLAENDISLPLVALYSPLSRQDMLLKPNEFLLKCHCGAIFNPYCHIDHQHGVWTCNFCQKRSPFAKHMMPMSKENIWMFPTTSEEYHIESKKIDHSPRTFVFILDTCLDLDEFTAMTSTMKTLLTELPSNTRVGLVTISHRSVLVHQVISDNNTGVHGAVILPGLRDMTSQQVADYLRLDQTGMADKYIQPIKYSINVLTNLLHTLKPDSHSYRLKRRARPTGKALSVALGLLEKTQSGRSDIVTCVGGPCTIGPGKVIGIDLKETKRTVSDILLKTALHMEEALAFYKKTALRARQADVSIHLFAHSHEETGLVEMISCAELTGGQTFAASSFSSFSFEQNLRATLSQLPIIADSFEVKSSEGLVVKPIAKEDVKMLHRNTTVSVYFDIMINSPLKTGYIQFITSYQNRLRVTTVARNWVDPVRDRDGFVHSLDPLAAVVVAEQMARLEPDPAFWLYKQNQKALSIASTINNSCLHEYASLLGYLCQSPVISSCNSSPDHMAYVRSLFYSSNVNQAVWMIRPYQWNFYPNGNQFIIHDYYYTITVYWGPSETHVPLEVMDEIIKASYLHERHHVPEVSGFRQRVQ